MSANAAPLEHGDTLDRGSGGRAHTLTQVGGIAAVGQERPAPCDHRLHHPPRLVAWESDCDGAVLESFGHQGDEARAAPDERRRRADERLGEVHHGPERRERRFEPGGGLRRHVAGRDRDEAGPVAHGEVRHCSGERDIRRE